MEDSYGKDGSRRMPIDHRIEDSLEDDGLQMASVHTAIPESNVGFQMLQRMGWKGSGLGSNEDGMHFLPIADAVYRRLSSPRSLC